jgi:hypothetical protein
MKITSLVRLSVAAFFIPFFAVAATSAFAASQSLTFPPLTSFVWKGGSASLAATASSGLPVTYSVAAGPCLIVGIVLTATGAGGCTVNADQAGDANFTAAPTVSNSVNVSKAPQTVVVSAPLSIPYYSTASGTIPLTVTGSGSGFIDGRRDSDSAPCILINLEGGFRLYGTRVGTCSLDFYEMGNDDYFESPRVNVSIAITIGSQTLDFPPLRDRVFGDLPYDIAITPSSLSSNLYAAVTSLTPTVCVVVTIPQPPQPVIGPRPPRYEVTLISTGVCTLRASQDGNNNYLPATPIEQSFNIAKSPQIITFPQIADQSGALKLITISNIYSTSNLPVYVDSLTPSVCQVNGNIVVPEPPGSPTSRTISLFQAGTCTLYAIQDGNANFLSAPIIQLSFQVTPTGVIAQTITFPPIPNQVVGIKFDLFTSQVKDNPIFSSSGLSVSVVSLTPGVCTIGTLIGEPLPQTITITSVYFSSVGTCTLRATQAGNDSYRSATPVEQSFNIAKGSQTITFPPIPDQVFSTETTNVRLLPAPAGSVTLISLTPNVCSVVPAEGILPTGSFTIGVKALSTGVCTLRATQNGNDNYLPAIPVERSFNITKADTALREFTLAPDVVNPRAGTPITLTALIRGVAPNGVVSFTTTQVSEITNPTVPVIGCTNLSVSLLPVGTDSAVATCTTIAEAGARRYTASYSNDASNQVNPATITTNSPSAGPIDYSDIWWAGAAESGWGMSIAQKGLQQFNAFYVYDADGKPVWYVMSGGSWNADFTRFAAAVYQPTSSSFTNYDARRLQIGAALGTATITFTDANNAVFNYTLNGITGQKNMSRLKFGAPDVAPKINVKDIWWAGEAENGWGVSIAQQNRTLFASWYTYGADGKATWFVMSGGAWTGTSYSGELYITSSGPWLGVPYVGTKFRTQLVGAVTFDFSDANRASMTYTVNGVAQTKIITRLGF